MEGGVIEHKLHHLQQVAAKDVRVPLTDSRKLDVIDRLRRLPAELGQGLDAHLLHLLHEQVVVTGDEPAADAEKTAKSLAAWTLNLSLLL